MILKKIFFVFFAFYLLFVPLSCSDGSGDSEPTVIKCGYKMWTSTSNGGNAHRVTKYIAVETGLGSFDVKSFSVHYFMTSNPTYNVASGYELCDIVEKNSVEPTVTKTYSLTKDSTGTLTYSSTNEKEFFYMKAGLSYTVNYYF